MSTDHSTSCSVPGCEKNRKGYGLCQGHLRQQKSGKPIGPLKTRRPFGSPPIIAYDEIPCPRTDLIGPCRIFRGSKIKGGYGHVGLNGGTVYVHRYVWEQENGPIPEKMEIDHQCRVRTCCNVRHLRCVTKQVNLTENIENAMWQRGKAKTHCPRGHEYSETNTYKRPRGGRTCRECKRSRSRADYARSRIEGELPNGNGKH